jgi:ribonuclease H / adenosylcobalamin/alpha-ribazole phosphatase
VRGVRPHPGPDGGLGFLTVPGPDLGPPVTLVLVRHGSTDDTDRGKARGGAAEGPPLNANGRQQVAHLTRALADQAGADHGYELPVGRPPWVEVLGSRPAAVVTSPLRRARQTADMMAAPLHLTPVVDDAWREIGLGVWDGLSYGEIAARWPEEFRAWCESPEVAPPGGESLTGLAARVEAGRRRLVEEHRGCTVLVVSHTAPIRSVIAGALGAGPDAYWRLRLEPGAVSVVRFWTDGGVEVSTVNSTGHLG